MKERRNYYRILGVQPDAPDDVICGVYRTLMQKLRMHPDLGGDQRTAAMINSAWQVLRDPVRRQAYDQELLESHDIRLLASAGNTAASQGSGSSRNRRNFYRVLGVQSDAARALIDSAYRTAVSSSSAENRDLIEEAYAVLADPEQRAQYDSVQAELDPIVCDEPVSYIPAIVAYCLFCKTPHNPYPGQPAAKNCSECGCPKPTDQMNDSEDGRSFSRNDLTGPVEIYQYWSGPAQNGLLEEFTPKGLRLTTAWQLDSDQIVRVTTEVFDAVARVVHCVRRDDVYSSGMALLATAFTAGGVFINTRS